MNKKMFVPALLIAWTMAMLIIASGARPSDTNNKKVRENIVGSWKVTVFFTEPPGFPPVQALYSFADGGAFVMTANNVDPRVIGPGHGAWSRIGEHEFGLTFIRMRFDPTTNPPTYLGTLKALTSGLRLNDTGDEWTVDRWAIDFYDPDGNFIRRAFEGTAKAERISVEPLE